MGSVLAEGACLCCCSCCGEVNTACKRLLGPSKSTKILYLCLVLAILIPAILISFVLKDIFTWIDLASYITLQLRKIIQRTSLSLLCLFLIMLVLMLCRNNFSIVINQGLFSLKYLLVVCLFIGSLFLNAQFLNAYSFISRYISIGYMIIQSIILIDLFYIAGIKLAKKYSSGQTSSGGILIVSTIIIEVLAIFMNIVGYIHFSYDNCGSTLWLNILTTIILIILPLVQLLQLNPQNSLLTTSLTSLLISYFSYSAQLSFKQGCTYRLNTYSYAADVCVCIFMFILTSFGSVVGGLSEQPQFINNDSPSQQQVNQANQKLYTVSWSWFKWHFYMCLASIYLSMILSNWQSTQLIAQHLQGNHFAFSIRVFICFLTSLLYIWTMIVPYLLPDRIFQLE